MTLDEELKSLTAKLVDARADGPEAERKIQLERRHVQSQKDKLYLEELKRQREFQQDSQVGSIYEQTLFYYYRRAMPERDRLAQLLPSKSSIRSPAEARRYERLGNHLQRTLSSCLSNQSTTNQW
jgi:carbonic anhydrase